jgi:hypothetical protein
MRAPCPNNLKWLAANMAATKHHILRMTDANWNQLADTFRLVVPAERRPTNARLDSDWQITEGLRMIANGELTISQPRYKPRTINHYPTNTGVLPLDFHPEP